MSVLEHGTDLAADLDLWVSVDIQLHWEPRGLWAWSERSY